MTDKTVGDVLATFVQRADPELAASLRAAAHLPRRVNACACGDCYHPAFGPNTDGEPCDWCQDCGCPSADHATTPRETDEMPEEGDQ